MKISYRVGVMPGSWSDQYPMPDFLWDLIDVCENSEIDSIWFSERISAPVPVLEPMMVMAAMAARTKRLKFGPSVLTMPHRNPVLLAREFAMLDVLSGGRVLPAVGIGGTDEKLFQATGVSVKERASRTDEAIQVMRACWTGEPVQHEGRFWKLDGLTVLPRPVQQPMPLWIGGSSEAAARRVGRLGDGWIPSFIPPERVKTGVQIALEEAARCQREVEIDHFGALLYYCLDPDPAAALAIAQPFIPAGRGDPDTVTKVTAFGPPALVRERLEQYVDAGASKFILRPMCPPDQMLDQLAWLSRDVIAEFQGRR